MSKGAGSTGSRSLMNVPVPVLVPVPNPICPVASGAGTVASGAGTVARQTRKAALITFGSGSGAEMVTWWPLTPISTWASGVSGTAGGVSTPVAMLNL